jgi:hypothetical protein
MISVTRTELYPDGRSCPRHTGQSTENPAGCGVEGAPHLTGLGRSESTTIRRAVDIGCAPSQGIDIDTAPLPPSAVGAIHVEMADTTRPS